MHKELACIQNAGDRRVYFPKARLCRSPCVFAFMKIRLLTRVDVTGGEYGAILLQLELFYFLS